MRQIAPKHFRSIRTQPALVVWEALWYFVNVSTLAQIEAAADKLTAEEKQELLVFIAARLRAERPKLPEPRKFSREQLAAWIAQDEADMKGFRESE